MRTSRGLAAWNLAWEMVAMLRLPEAAWGRLALVFGVWASFLALIVLRDVLVRASGNGDGTDNVGGDDLNAE